jgi:hypothetical protein
VIFKVLTSDRFQWLVSTYGFFRLSFFRLTNDGAALNPF